MDLSSEGPLRPKGQPYRSATAAVESVRALARSSVELAGTLDFTQAAHRIVASVLSLMGGRRAHLYRFEHKSGDLVGVAAAGVGDPGSIIDQRFSASGGLSGRAFAENRPVWVPDILADAAIGMDGRVREEIRREGFSAMAAVPLRARGEWVGSLVLLDETGRRFADEELALLTAFGEQAALALDNARLFNEAEDRRRAAEALAEIGRTLSRTLDPDVVGGEVVRSLKALLRAKSAAVYLQDTETGELVKRVASIETDRTFDWLPTMAAGMGLTGVALREGVSLSSPDMLSDTRIAYPPELRSRIQQASARALLVVPLRVPDRVLGVLLVGDETGRVFDSDDLALTEAFALQAALALENSRIHGEATRRRRQAEELAHTARLLTETLEIQTVSQRIVESVAALVGVRSASLRLLEADGTLLSLAVTTALGPFGVPGTRTPSTEGVSGLVVTGGRALMIPDIFDYPGLVLSEDVARRARASGEHSFLGVPLRVKDRIIGVLSLAAPAERRFFAEEMALLQAFGDQAALALDNARLFTAERVAHHEAESGARALEESQRTLATLMSNLPGMVYRGLNQLDRPMDFVSEGCLDLTGYPPAEITEARVTYGGLIQPDDRAAVWREVQEALGAHRPFRLTYRIRPAQGPEKWVLEQGRGIVDASGALVALEGFVIDVTEQKRTEGALREAAEQLRQSQKMEAIGRLAGGVAHDFNNLLTVISGRADLLLLRASGDERVRRDLDLIRKTAERAAALTRQLLAFSRKQVLQPRVLDLNVVVAELEPMLRRVIGEDIELVARPAAVAGWVQADPSQLQQVLLNLVVNARDAMPQGGRLTIETGDVTVPGPDLPAGDDLPPGRHVRLSVRDAGVGMEPGVKTHIFEPFFTTKEVGKGTGLGLATVYGIVVQSGGQIRFDSAPGLGTEFRIYLPAVPAPTETDNGEAGSRMRRGSETVLVVEDEVEVRSLARDILETVGYTVLEAAGLTDALELVQQHGNRIHIALTDMVMPGMSGHELVVRLAAVAPEIRVLYMSGYTDEAIGRDGVLDSTTPFLQKPFTPEALTGKIREVLDAPGAGPPP